jgi:electron transfer flavoprotein alpha/beta subunit
MAAKKKEIRKVPLPAGLQPTQEIMSLALPTRSKQTRLIEGSASQAAQELVKRLREEARAL